MVRDAVLRRDALDVPNAPAPLAHASKGRGASLFTAVVGAVLFLMMSVTAIPAVVASPASASGVTIVAAGDIACAPNDTAFSGTDPARCQMRNTADLISSLAPTAVLPLGDDQDYTGTLTQYQGSYALTWGNTGIPVYPVPGNLDYGDTTDSDTNTQATDPGYLAYFGSAAVNNQGWYSYNLGAWHIIALNSQCAVTGGCAAGSPEETWLRQDLAAHPAACILAYWHEPRWSDGMMGNEPIYSAFWQDLYNAGADVVLNAHDRTYERFARQDPNGVATPTGIRELVAGTGGVDLGKFQSTFQSTSEFHDGSDFGVLDLSLGSTSYSWQFIGTSHQVIDSGSTDCHGAPNSTTTTTTTTTAATTTTTAALSSSGYSGPVDVASLASVRAASVTSEAVTTGVASNAGDTLLVGVSLGSNVQVSSVTDSAGNQYSPVYQRATSGYPGLYVFEAANAASLPAGGHIDVSLTGSSNLVVQADDWASTSGALTVLSNGDGTGTSVDVGPSADNSSEQAVLGYAAIFGSTSVSTPSGWSSQSTSGGPTLSQSWQPEVNSGSYGYTDTLGADRAYTWCELALAPLGSGTTTTTTTTTAPTTTTTAATTTTTAPTTTTTGVSSYSGPSDVATLASVRAAGVMSETVSTGTASGSGDTLLVGISVGSAVQVNSVVDSAGNTYSQVFGLEGITNRYPGMYVYEARDAAPLPASGSVTVDLSGSSNVVVQVDDWASASGTTSVIGAQTGAGSSVSVGPGADPAAQTAVVGYVSIYGSTTVTPASGWATDTTGGGPTLSAAWQPETSSGSYGFTEKLSADRSYSWCELVLSS